MRRGTARLLAMALLALASLPARADTPISLFQSFRGNVNFVGTEETLRTKDNTKPCSLVNSANGIRAYLSGIPSGATIKSAQLYWAGSGTTPDYTVTFDGVPVTAARQYQSKVYANNTYYSYFSGAADVTSQVSKKGNGYYSFRGLTVATGNPWCAVQGVVGGFALAVVYSHPNEPFRMLNLYEGFQSFRDSGFTINLGNFNVPDPLPSTVTGRLGHITWEGDATLSQGGEDLLFNGYAMTDSMNPQGSQFNSASNVTGDSSSFGIDFDIYTLKPPVIQPGQSTATTTYRTGQDMVLASAEIVAMPYVASADLALAMTRSGDLTVGSSTDYTLTVTNAGIDDETGPVTVVDTLPSGLRLVSAGGAGWTCTNVAGSTQTVVTCTQPGPLKPGAKMTPLVIAVTPTATASYTNTATVSGKTGDNNSSNNTATNASTSTEYASVSVLFTREPCNDGDKIVTSPLDAGCHKFIGPVVAADSGSKIYITAVNSAQVATAQSSSDYKLSIDLKFSCLPNATNPAVAISYAGKTDFDCIGTWQTVSVKLPGGKPTAVLNDGLNTPLAPFFYADVGRVSLTMRYNGNVIGMVNFISKPQDIQFRDILRSADSYQDPGGLSGSLAWAKPDIGFARAGEQFMLRIGARMADGKWAPSFGREASALAGVLPADALGVRFELDTFAVNLKGTPKLPIAAKDPVVREAFVLDQDFVRSTATSLTNMYEAKARYFEAGLLGITPRLVDYLGTGQVGGSSAAPDSAGRLVDSTRVAGRFYPEHFVTQATSNFQCLAAMNCPATTGLAVSGAAYSMQPFNFSVKAFGLPRDSGGAPTLLSLYQDLIIDSANPRPLLLTASSAPNLSAAPAVGAFATDPTAQLKAPATGDDFPDLGGAATWRLGAPYDPVKRAAGGFGAPTPVYLRASMTEFRGAAGTTTGYTTETVTSQTPAGAPAGTQYEDGLMVAAGRLFVANVFGSDLLRLPVPLAAQYWSGTAWAASTSDQDSMVASAIRPATNGCRKFFAQDPKTGACKADPLAVAGTLPIRVRDGRGTLVLQAPARGTIGSVDYTLDSTAAPWLPSTQARATFGLYRSPLIYLREVY